MTEKPASAPAAAGARARAVEDAVLTALEKLPADRFAQRGGVRGGAGDAAGRSRTRISAASRSRPRVPRRARDGARGSAIRWCSGLGALAVAGALLAAWTRRTRAERAGAGGALRASRRRRAAAPTRSATTSSRCLADGRTLVYLGQGDSRRQRLMVRALDDVTARPLPGTEDAGASDVLPRRPVGRLHSRQSALTRSPSTARRRSCSARRRARSTASSWSSSGVIVVSGNTALYAIPEAGGRPGCSATRACRR